MSACNFTIPFTGDAAVIMGKAKSSVESQGGNFTGDTQSGNFSLSIFGNSIAGTYSVTGQELNIVIDEKPFLVPCSAIESFLKQKIA